MDKFKLILGMNKLMDLINNCDLQEQQKQFLREFVSYNGDFKVFTSFPILVKSFENYFEENRKNILLTKEKARKIGFSQEEQLAIIEYIEKTGYSINIEVLNSYFNKTNMSKEQRLTILKNGYNIPPCSMGANDIEDLIKDIDKMSTSSENKDKLVNLVLNSSLLIDLELYFSSNEKERIYLAGVEKDSEFYEQIKEEAKMIEEILSPIMEQEIAKIISNKLNKSISINNSSDLIEKEKIKSFKDFLKQDLLKLEKSQIGTYNLPFLNKEAVDLINKIISTDPLLTEKDLTKRERAIFCAYIITSPISSDFDNLLKNNYSINVPFLRATMEIYNITQMFKNTDYLLMLNNLMRNKKGPLDKETFTQQLEEKRALLISSDKTFVESDLSQAKEVLEKIKRI